MRWTLGDSMRPLVCGFLKVRNEAVKEGNLDRCLQNMATFCDTIVACDDASTDGTDLILEEFFAEKGYPPEQLLRVLPEEQDLRLELRVKARMLDIVHHIQPLWIWWHDGDEVLPVPFGERLKMWLAAGESSCFDDWRTARGFPMPTADGYRFPYVQLWRSGSWARIDDGFADGSFIKLWRWRDDLRFDIVDRTHHMQFPLNMGQIEEAPGGMYVLHFGNYGKNLQMKVHQYWGGLGGIERHRDFEHGVYKELEHDYRAYPALLPATDPRPEPFTADEKGWINDLRNLRGLEGYFTVAIPTHNRAGFLGMALGSLRKQIYTKWIAIVIDDGSTDDTPQVMRFWQNADPRIFYVRHRHRGAVAMNEIAMAMAVEQTEYWTRLGSDDYFEPMKLQNDAIVLRSHDWCYGPYRVLRQNEDDWQTAELCNIPDVDGKKMAERLRDGKFCVSWANVACRTSLLKKIRERHGSFCDPRLQNMEDFLVGSRMARESFPVWRGRIRDGDRLLLGFDAASCAEAFHQQFQYVHDAIWRVNPIGASSDGGTTARDDELTRQLIAEENR